MTPETSSPAEKKVTESIFSGRTVIPMADVQHIEKHWIKGNTDKNNPDGILIITKHTKWSREIDTWENNIYLSFSGENEAAAFLSAWCQYRYELEFDTLADLDSLR